MANNISNLDEIRITNFNRQVKKDLTIIAKNKGYNQLGPYLKMELRKLRDSIPEHMRKAIDD